MILLPTDDYFVSHTDKLFFPTRISPISRISIRFIGLFIRGTYTDFKRILPPTDD